MRSKFYNYSIGKNYKISTSSSSVLSDEGLIHQLIHLMHIPDEPLINVIAIRSQFEAELYWVTQEEI